MGHSTLCSKVLIPCPFKCGSYIQRADLAKHKAECNNNFRKSANLDVDKVPSNGTFNAYSLVKPYSNFQITALKSSLSSADILKTESAKKWEFVQEKLIHLQNLQMDLSLLKQTLFKDSSHFRKTQMDFATNLEDIRTTFNQQIASFENMWHQQTSVIQEAIRNISDVRQAIDEQKAKYAALVFELRTVSQISSEASQKIEIMERDFGKVQQELNQMKILLYINGLNKWKGRYALACIHVLKGKYDPLLAWPCIIEGQISLRDLTETSQKKDFIKFIKTKRPSGDEDEDEPQESSPTYIFIPHSVMLKANYTKNDTLFLDVNISENQTRHETSL
ncbi:hypothetical protein YQE_05065, partial [Dendroctonus ponderosae]